MSDKRQLEAAPLYGFPSGRPVQNARRPRKRIDTLLAVLVGVGVGHLCAVYFGGNATMKTSSVSSCELAPNSTDPELIWETVRSQSSRTPCMATDKASVDCAEQESFLGSLLRGWKAMR